MDKIDRETARLTKRLLKKCSGINTVSMIGAGLNLVENACKHSDEYTRAKTVVFLRSYADKLEKESTKVF